jgi:hypothetical protein
MRVRVLRRQNSSYLELPQEMAGNEELELFQLKPGYYLLSVPFGAESGGQSAKTGAQESEGTRIAQQKPVLGAAEQLTSAERAVLQKLLAIRFDQRIPANVSRMLDDGEKAVLKELERRGLVNVFKGTKYKDGVYNIKDSAFSLAQKGGENDGARQAGRTMPQAAQPSFMNQASNDLAASLKARGFIVINDRNQARALSESLSGEMKNGSVAGVKGFDNKFYVVTRDYLTQAQISITKALKEDMDAATVATAAKLDPEGCMAVLRILSEAGEILEKKKGVFAPV